MECLGNKITQSIVCLIFNYVFVLSWIVKEVDRELMVDCDVFSLLIVVANYNITKFSNNCIFSNDTAEHLN